MPYYHDKSIPQVTYVPDEPDVSSRKGWWRVTVEYKAKADANEPPSK